jgi:uncharacterized repeat protein (TIGR01451 family)
VAQSVFRRRLMTAGSLLLLTLLVGFLPPPRLALAGSVTLNPSSGAPGTTVTATGSGWTPGNIIKVDWDSPPAIAQTTVNSNGGFTVSFNVPSNATSGNHTVYFTEVSPSGGSGTFQPATFTVTSGQAGADLSVTKTASANRVTWGDPLTYRVTVTNNGPSTATNITIVDTLPDKVSYTSLIFGQGNCTTPSGNTPGGTIQCTLASLSAGSSVTAVIDVSPLNGSGTLVNRATASANESDPNTANNTATVNTMLVPFGTPTATNTPIPTRTPTSTRTPTVTRTPSPTNTATPTRTPRPSSTPTNTSVPSSGSTCGQLKIANPAPECPNCSFIFVLVPSNNDPIVEVVPLIPLSADHYYRIHNPQITLRNTPFPSIEYGVILDRISNWSSAPEINPSECPSTRTPTPIVTPTPANVKIVDFQITQIEAGPKNLYVFKHNILSIKLKNMDSSPFIPGQENGSSTVELILRDSGNKKLGGTKIYYLQENLPLLRSGQESGYLRVGDLFFFQAIQNGKIELTFKPAPSLHLQASSINRNITIDKHPESFWNCLAEVVQTVIDYLQILHPTWKIQLSIADLAARFTKCYPDTHCATVEFGKWLAGLALSYIPHSDELLGELPDLLSKIGENNQVPTCINLVDVYSAYLHELLRNSFSVNGFFAESPVYPVVLNEAGQRTGFLRNGQIVEEIQASRAVAIGEKRLILYPGIKNVNVHVVGYANGTMTLTAAFAGRENTGVLLSYKNVQVIQGMEAVLVSTDEQFALQIDINGDGSVDQSRLPDTIQHVLPVSKIYLPILRR